MLTFAEFVTTIVHAAIAHGLWLPSPLPNLETYVMAGVDHRAIVCVAIGGDLGIYAIGPLVLADVTGTTPPRAPRRCWDHRTAALGRCPVA